MKRTTKTEFADLLAAVRAAPEEERQAIGYYASLAYQRQQHGTHVYVHADAPAVPNLLSVLVSQWGRSQNRYHRDVTIHDGKANFGPARCRALCDAAGGR